MHRLKFGQKNLRCRKRGPKTTVRVPAQRRSAARWCPPPGKRLPPSPPLSRTPRVFESCGIPPPPGRPPPLPRRRKTFFFWGGGRKHEWDKVRYRRSGSNVRGSSNHEHVARWWAAGGQQGKKQRATLEHVLTRSTNKNKRTEKKKKKGKTSPPAEAEESTRESRHGLVHRQLPASVVVLPDPRVSISRAGNEASDL